MAKEKPDDKDKPEEDSQETPSSPTMSDEDVTKLFANISEDAEKPDEPDGDNAEGEEGKDKPPAEPPPATFDPAALQTPEGQKAIADAVNRMVAAQDTEADAKSKREELQKLIADNNVEELGKRYIASLQGQEAGQEAVDSVLTNLYRGLFSDPAFQNLTAEERKEIEPDARFRSDADYVKFLAAFMAKKQGLSVTDEQLQEKVNERIEAMKREAAGKKARSSSVVGAAPADGGTPARPTDSRTLIQEGLRETFTDHYAE